MKAPVFELEFARLEKPFNNVGRKTEHVYLVAQSKVWEFVSGGVGEKPDGI